MSSVFLLRDARYATHDIFFCASLQVKKAVRNSAEREAEEGVEAREKEKSIIKNRISANHTDHCNSGNLPVSDALIQWNQIQSGEQYDTDGCADGWKERRCSGK